MSERWGNNFAGTFIGFVVRKNCSPQAQGGILTQTSLQTGTRFGGVHTLYGTRDERVHGYLGEQFLSSQKATFRPLRAAPRAASPHNMLTLCCGRSTPQAVHARSAGKLIPVLVLLGRGSACVAHERRLGGPTAASWSAPVGERALHAARPRTRMRPWGMVERPDKPPENAPSHRR